VSLRRWLAQIHLWCGLVLAVYAIAIGVSGGLLVFESRLIASEYPEFHRPAFQRTRTTGVAKTLREVRSRYPEWRALSVTWPNEDCPYWMIYLIRSREALEVYSDGRSIVGARNPSAGWIGFVRRLHVSLLGGSAGRLVNGCCAALLLVLAVTGVALWVPGKRLAFRLREMHYAMGIVCAMFIALLAFTGLYFVWPQLFVDTVGRVWTRAGEPRLVTEGRSASALLPLDDLAGSAQASIPNRSIYRIEVVERPDQAVHVTFLEGTVAEFHRVSTVVLDPTSGRVLQRRLLSERRTGDSILAWFSALHFGVFGGWAVKIVWSVWALSLPLLALSGFLMWRRRWTGARRELLLRTPRQTM